MRSKELELIILAKMMSKVEDIENLALNNFDPLKFSPFNSQMTSHIMSYFRKYGKKPTSAWLLSELQAEDSSVTALPQFPDLRSHKDAVVYHYELFLKTKKIEELHQFAIDSKSLVNDFDKLVTEHTVDDLLRGISDWTNEVDQRYSHDVNRPLALASYGPLISQQYDDIKHGRLVGIEPYFEHLKLIIKYFYPGQVTACVARTGVGKTWWAILNALAAVNNKWSTLFISYEMAPDALARRLYSVAAGVPYGDVVQGTLSMDDEVKYKDAAAKYDADKFLHIADTGSFKTPEAIALEIDRLKSKLVVVDAFYLIQNVPGTKTWEKVSYLTAMFKKMALEKKVHIILTSQFNKEARGFETSNEFAVAFSDAINHNVDFRIELVQPQELKKNNQLDMVIGKGRETKSGDAYRYNWDIGKMNFKCIGMAQRKKRKSKGFGKFA